MTTVWFPWCAKVLKGSTLFVQSAKSAKKPHSLHCSRSGRLGLDTDYLTVTTDVIISEQIQIIVATPGEVDMENTGEESEEDLEGDQGAYE